MRQVVALLAAVVLVITAHGIASAQAVLTAVIQGQVLNGTSGGASVSDIELNLFTINNGQVTQSDVVSVDSDGRFSFDNVPVVPDTTYVIGLFYGDCNYYTEVESFTDNETKKDVEITVYDPTTDDSQISIVNEHTIVFVEEDHLIIQEVYLFANMSDRTYVGVAGGASGEKATLHFSLPAGYSELAPGGDLTILQGSSGNEFADTIPVQPGTRQVYFSYQVKPGSGSYEYKHKINYPTLKYNLYVGDANLTINSEQLGPGDDIEMGGVLYKTMSGSNFAAGSDVSFRISGISGSSPSIFLWVGIALLLVVIAAGGVYIYTQKRRRQVAVPVEDDEESAVLEDIAQLDEDYENGKMDEVTYQQNRTRMKAQLTEIIKSKSDKGNA